jgi:hypothetical protein
MRLLGQAPSKIGEAQIEAKRLIDKFDNMPFQEKCRGKNCSQTATYFTLRKGTVIPYFWCDNCNPIQAGSSEGDLEILKSYSQVLSHGESYSWDENDYRRLFRFIFEAKGLTKPVTENKAVSFFQ